MGRAAEIAAGPIDGSGDPAIFITGDITSGDAGKFAEVAATLPRAMVVLSSNGGALADGLAIGTAIRAAGYATAVPAGASCYSACALIWAGGSRRFLAPSAVLGAHAAYHATDGGTETSGIGNAQVGAYLARLGYGDAAIRFFTVAGPDSMMILTPEIAAIIDLQFEVFQSPLTAPASRPPTAGDSADIAALTQVLAAFSYMSRECSDYLQPDPYVLGEEIKAVLANLPDRADWEGAFQGAVDEMMARDASQGRLQNCLAVEGILRQSGFRTGVIGPSFDCSAAQTRTEVALCMEPDLWPLDRVMNAIYLHVRAIANAATRKSWLAEQRAWMARRDACGNDKVCIIARYKERLDPLRDIALN